MIINKKNFSDYILLLVVIAISGIPYFTTTILYIPVFSFLLIIFYLRKCSFDKQFIYFILIVFLITLLQIYTFDIFYFETTLGVFLRILIAYFIIKILNIKFIKYYINIIFVFAIISLSIHIPILIFPSLVGFLKSNIVPLFSFANIAQSPHATFLIHNLNQIELFRNSGPFWEPGAFGGYLVLAFIFNQVTENNKKKNIIFLIAILTTLSSTAYIATGIFLTLFYYKKISNIFLRYILIATILSVGTYLYNTVDFLGKKIEDQLSQTKNAHVYGADDNTQRFLNILRDIEDFKNHEIIGRGTNPMTRYSQRQLEQIRTVGVTDIIVRFGLPFFLLILYFLYKSANSITKDKHIISSLAILLSILTTLMSEVYFNFPIYWCLLFLFLIYKKQEENT